jgi:hypothetical protein
MQVFSTLYSSNDNALVCAPTGSGKTVCAELAVLQMIASVEGKQAAHEKDDSVVVPPLRAVYVASLPAIVKQTAASWEKNFGADGLGLTVVTLTGEQQVCCITQLVLPRRQPMIHRFLCQPARPKADCEPLWWLTRQSFLIQGSFFIVARVSDVTLRAGMRGEGTSRMCDFRNKRDCGDRDPRSMEYTIDIEHMGIVVGESL